VNIRVRDLTFSYGPFTLRVAAQDFGGSGITAVVGPNGAGKSTFLKCIASVLPVARGAVLIDGSDVAALSGRSRARLVGYVPQEPSFTFNYQVLDFVLTGRAADIPAFSSPSRRDIGIAEEALRFVGLEGFSERLFLDLSSGERRLVLIARTLAQQPAALLLDEPTTFLDPRHEVEMMELLRRLAREKEKTIVVTLHDLDMAVKYADDMVFMKDGSIVASGPPGSVLSESLLKAVYEIDMEIVRTDGRLIIAR
jgi:iron complex transport system ATP-binding protein